MRVITAPPKLVEQVHDAIAADIAEGRIRPGERIIQEQVAELLRVSRQPVQQALLLLRNEGLLKSAPGRGLVVAPIGPTQNSSTNRHRQGKAGEAYGCGRALSECPVTVTADIRGAALVEIWSAPRPTGSGRVPMLRRSSERRLWDA